jgi:cytochrome c
VYVVATQGVMLASGGPSVMLVGRDASSVLPDELKTAFQKALAEPEGQMRTAEYRWTNWNDGKIQRKHTYYRRIGDRVLAVGYYMPRANPTQAKTLLEQASMAVKADPQATLEAINALDPRFYQNDLYVFVVDLKTKRFIAHSYNQRLIGTDFQLLISADGKPIGQHMLNAVKDEGLGEFDYLWSNPVTNRKEPKHTYLNKVGDYLVAVGYYTR